MKKKKKKFSSSLFNNINGSRFISPILLFFIHYLHHLMIIVIIIIITFMHIIIYSFRSKKKEKMKIRHQQHSFFWGRWYFALHFFSFLLSYDIETTHTHTHTHTNMDIIKAVLCLYLMSKLEENINKKNNIINTSQIKVIQKILDFLSFHNKLKMKKVFFSISIYAMLQLDSENSWSDVYDYIIISCHILKSFFFILKPFIKYMEFIITYYLCCCC